jgi:hypothetical protein
MPAKDANPATLGDWNEDVEASQRLHGQLDLLPETLNAFGIPQQPLDPIRFAFHGNVLADCARAASIGARSDESGVIEIHPRHVRISTRHGTLSCRAKAPLAGTGSSVPDWGIAFSYDLSLLKSLRASGRDKAQNIWQSRLAFSEDLWGLRQGTDFVNVTPARAKFDLPSLDPLTIEPIEIDVPRLREALSMVSPATGEGEAEPCFQAVEVVDGIVRAGRQGTIVQWVGSGLEGVRMALTGRDLKTLLQLLSRTTNGRTWLCEHEGYYVIYDRVVEIFIEKPHFKLLEFDFLDRSVTDTLKTTTHALWKTLERCLIDKRFINSAVVQLERWSSGDVYLRFTGLELQYTGRNVAAGEPAQSGWTARMAARGPYDFVRHVTGLREVALHVLDDHLLQIEVEGAGSRCSMYVPILTFEATNSEGNLVV